MEKRVKVADVLRCEPCMFYTQRAMLEESGEDIMEIVLVTGENPLEGDGFDSFRVARIGLLEGDLSTVPDEIIQKYMAFTGASYVVEAGKYTFYLPAKPVGDIEFHAFDGKWTLSTASGNIFRSSDGNLVRRLYKALM